MSNNQRQQEKDNKRANALRENLKKRKAFIKESRSPEEKQAPKEEK